MRKETICLYENDLMFVVGGLLFKQSPNKQPRKAETIMVKVRDAFRKDAFNDNEWYTVHVPTGKMYSYIEKLMYSISEFEELNLSQIEYDNGVKIDDDREGYLLSSAYDKYDKDSWKDDFVDLDAFIRNVDIELRDRMRNKSDCFCCINAKSNICKTCINNPKHKSNFKGCRQPKGNYKFACKYDCYRSCYICCEECKHKETCKHKCDSNSSECGQAINHVKGDEPIEPKGV